MGRGPAAVRDARPEVGILEVDAAFGRMASSHAGVRNGIAGVPRIVARMTAAVLNESEILGPTAVGPTA